MIKYVLTILTMPIILVGCLSLPSVDDIGDIVEKSTQGIATVQIANAGKSLADTRKIKAETTQAVARDTMGLISKQPIDKQAELISQSIKAQVTVANNNTFKGMLIATAVWAIFLLLMRIAVFLFNRFSPKAKKTTTEF